MLSEVMTSGFNSQAFKHFSLKSARDHPEYPPAQWLRNSSVSFGVILFSVSGFEEKFIMKLEAGRV